MFGKIVVRLKIKCVFFDGACCWRFSKASLYSLEKWKSVKNVQKMWTFIPSTQSDIDYGDNPSIFSIIIFLRFYIVYYVFRQSARDRSNARLRTSNTKFSKRNFIHINSKRIKKIKRYLYNANIRLYEIRLRCFEKSARLNAKIILLSPVKISESDALSKERIIQFRCQMFNFTFSTRQLSKCVY